MLLCLYAGLLLLCFPVCQCVCWKNLKFSFGQIIHLEYPPPPQKKTTFKAHFNHPYNGYQVVAK